MAVRLTKDETLNPLVEQASKAVFERFGDGPDDTALIMDKCRLFVSQFLAELGVNLENEELTSILNQLSKDGISIEEKEIKELVKHIFQAYGTLIQKEIEERESNVRTKHEEL